ncbi:MFS transporter [Chitinophaga sp. RAB17]|uniref:MFS transporter n=1 Tax=Chitinophaga sp. RAB17 TaxID=3233049 RepID=UPI003F9147C1
MDAMLREVPLTPAVEAYSRRWLALTVLLMGAFLSPLDFFIVNVALPAIKTGLHASAGQLQFVVVAYGATYAVLVVTGGRLGDIYGRKRMFIAGMLLLTISSAVCGVSSNIHLLIAARTVQGLAAAVLAPQVLSSIRIIFPPAEQAKAMGFFGATFGLASIAGQLLGGVLMRLKPFGLTWESVFMINIPVGLLTILLAFFVLPETRNSKQPALDIPGMFLISGVLFLLIYPLIAGREAGWPWWVFVAMGMAVPVLWLFIRAEKRAVSRHKDPLVDLALFRDKHFVTGLGVIFLFNATAAFFMVYPVYLQNGLQYDVLRAGMAVLPYAAGFFLGPFSSPLLARRLGNAIVLLALALLALGFGMIIVGISLQAVPGILLYSGLLLAGVGHGIVLPSLVRITLAPVMKEKAGMAAGVVSTAIQMGSAVGVAVIGTVFFSVLGSGGSFRAAFVVALSCLTGLYLLAFALTLRLNKIKI